MIPELLLLIVLPITYGQTLPPLQDPTTPSTGRTPVICLKNTEIVYNKTYQHRRSVVCIYDDQDNVAYEYPEHEKLSQPVPRKCFERTHHTKSPSGTNYYFSWLDRKDDTSWVDARNFCRIMCMDLISLESPQENDWIKEQIEKKKISGVWTSGRLCDFKGCEYYRSPYMWPRMENGWFWAGTGVRIPPYEYPDTDWAQPGPLKNNRQPDNRAHEYSGKNEACIAILNNPYLDGIHWHDELCELKMPFVCEDNEFMLMEAQKSPDYS